METGATPATAYGLELAGGKITAVKARARGRAMDIELLADALDVTDPAWRAIATTIAREQDAGRALACAMAPAQDSFLRPVEAPFGSLVRARAVLPSLLDVQLPFPLEQCACAFAGLEKMSATASRAVALAMPKERLLALIADWRAAGVEPGWVEPETIALWRAHVPVGAASAVVLYLADDRTVAVAGRDGIPVASFNARASWSDGAEPAAREKLRARIQQFLAGAFQAGTGADPVFVISGRGSGTSEGLREALAVEPARWIVAPDAATGLARSLAASGLRPGTWSANLRTGDLASAGARRLEQRAWMRAALLTAASAIMLGAVAIAVPRLLDLRYAAVQQAIEEEVQRYTGAPYLPGQEQIIIRGGVLPRDDRERQLARWVEPVVYPLFKKLIDTAHARGMMFDALAMDPDEAILRGSANAWADVKLLADVFEQAGWRVETDPGGTGERVHFSLRARP